MSNIARLAYIAVSSRNPSALHKLLFECLQLDYFSLDTPDGSIDAYGVGDTALAVFPVGSTFLSKDKPGVDHLAFSTRNAKDAASLFINDAKHSSGINGAQQIQVPEKLTQGVFSRFTSITNLRGNSTEFVERMDHIGIASNSNIIAESIFSGKLGLPVESRQTDMEVKVSMESFTSDKY